MGMINRRGNKRMVKKFVVMEIRDSQEKENDMRKYQEGCNKGYLWRSSHIMWWGLEGGLKWKFVWRLFIKEDIQLEYLPETKKWVITKSLYQLLWRYKEVVGWLPWQIILQGVSFAYSDAFFKLSNPFVGDGLLGLKGVWKEVAKVVTTVNVYSSCNLE